jgi:hypothetical protein
MTEDEVTDGFPAGTVYDQIKNELLAELRNVVSMVKKSREKTWK